MNIEWLIPCRYVEVHDNLATIVGAGVEVFWVAGLPGDLEIPVAVKLTASVEELAEDQLHTTRNVVRDPGGETISDIAGEFRAGGDPLRPEWLASTIVQTVVRFTAPEVGTYTFEHFVDRSSLAIPMHVVTGPPLRDGPAPEEEEPEV